MERLVNENACKYCGSGNLSFGTYELISDELLMHKYACNDCEETDSNWYELTYIGKDE